MSELSLPICPICDAPSSLFRVSREAHGQTYVWYECRACASVLLWAGGERWIYQKVGREDKAHLVKQPLTVGDLLALLPQIEEPAERVAPAIPAPADVVPEPAEEVIRAAPIHTDVVPEPTERIAPVIPVHADLDEEPVEGDTSVRVIRRLIPWLLILCLVGLLTLVAIVVYGVVTGSIDMPLLNP